MEMKIQVPFQQLLSLVKTLTPAQKAKLRRELEEVPSVNSDKEAFMEFLLHGPVYTEKDLAIIEENRKSITAWRTKS